MRRSFALDFPSSFSSLPHIPKLTAARCVAQVSSVSLVRVRLARLLRLGLFSARLRPVCAFRLFASGSAFVALFSVSTVVLPASCLQANRVARRKHGRSGCSHACGSCPSGPPAPSLHLVSKVGVQSAQRRRAYALPVMSTSGAIVVS